jgi:hypothetical protein
LLNFFDIFSFSFNFLYEKFKKVKIPLDFLQLLIYNPIFDTCTSKKVPTPLKKLELRAFDFFEKVNNVF